VASAAALAIVQALERLDTVPPRGSPHVARNRFIGGQVAHRFGFQWTHGAECAPAGSR
jgi:hypothetical protein